MDDNINNWIENFFDLNPDADRHVAVVKKVKEYKNDLFKDVIPALDRRDIRYYSTLTDEQKKDISIWTLTRWMSSTGSNSADQIYTVNEVVNKDSMIFSSKTSENSLETNKHKELQWMLLAISGTGRREQHVWPTVPQKPKKSLLEDALIKLNPLLKDDELELLQKINTRTEFEEYFKHNAFDDKTIREFFKNEPKGK